MDTGTPLNLPPDLTALLGPTGGLLDILKSGSMGPPPTTDPIMQIGAILAGIGSGMQGKANPVTEMLMRRQEQDVSRRLALAQLGLTAQGQAGTRAHQQKLEGFRQQELDAAKRTMEASLAEKMLKLGEDTGDKTMIGDALKRLLGNTWGQYDTSTIAEAVSNKATRDFLKANSADMVLDASLGRITPDLQKRGQHILEAMKDDKTRAALLAHYKLPEPGDTLAKVVTERNEAQLRQDRIAATRRVQEALAANRSPEAADMLLANKDLNLTTEAMTVMALSQSARGLPVSGVFQTYLGAWDRQQKSITTAQAAQEAITRLHNLQITQAEKSAPVDEITALLKMLQTTVGTVTTLEGSTMPPGQKTALLGRLAKMIETQQALVEKTMGKTQAVTDLMKDIAQQVADAQARMDQRLKDEAAKRATTPAASPGKDGGILVPGSPADRAARAAAAIVGQKRRAVPPELPGMLP